MKRILTILSIATFMATPTTSLAQNTDNCNKCPEAPACCQKQQCPDSCKQCDKKCLAKSDTCTTAANCKECCKTVSDKKLVADKKKDFRGEHRGKKGFGKRMAPMDPFKGITLTAEQKQKVKALTQQARVDSQKARINNDEKNAEDATKIIAAYEKEIKNILTPEQFKQYQENKETMKSNRPAKRKR